jgi:hypothetical protein
MADANAAEVSSIVWKRLENSIIRIYINAADVSSIVWKRLENSVIRIYINAADKIYREKFYMISDGNPHGSGVKIKVKAAGHFIRRQSVNQVTEYKKRQEDSYRGQQAGR